MIERPLAQEILDQVLSGLDLYLVVLDGINAVLDDYGFAAATYDAGRFYRRRVRTEWRGAIGQGCWKLIASFVIPRLFR